MTNENTQNEKTLPSLEVFMVVEDSREGHKAKWVKIGAAWKHKDGEGFGIQFDGQMTLRTRKEKTEENGGE